MRRFWNSTIIGVTITALIASCGGMEGEDQWAPGGGGGKADGNDEVTSNQLETFKSAQEFVLSASASLFHLLQECTFLVELGQ